MANCHIITLLITKFWAIFLALTATFFLLFLRIASWQGCKIPDRFCAIWLTNVNFAYMITTILDHIAKCYGDHFYLFGYFSCKLSLYIICVSKVETLNLKWLVCVRFRIMDISCLCDTCVPVDEPRGEDQSYCLWDLWSWWNFSLWWSKEKNRRLHQTGMWYNMKQ